MAGDDGDDFRSERDFMDALRVLKARSGLSYREIAARMARTDPRHAMSRSALAGLLVGSSLPRRPGQVSALVDVLATELNESDQIPRYLRAWSRLVTARSETVPTAAPVPARPAVLVPPVPVARPAASVRVPPPDPLEAAATSSPENAFSARQLGALLFWLTLLTVTAFILWAPLPSGVPFWTIWLMCIWPIPLAGVINWLGRARSRRGPVLTDAPASYLHMEYRSKADDRWPI